MATLLTQKKFDFVSHSPELAPDAFAVVAFSGFEGFSTCYQFEITLVATDPEIDMTAVLAHPATFTILREEGDIPFHGILTEFEQLHAIDEYVVYKTVLSPKLWWLSLTHHNQIFLNRTVPQMLEAVLLDGGLTTEDFELRLMNPGRYSSWEFICQYGESHLNFVSRWMEREGMYYFFEQTPAGEKVIITDTGMSHGEMAEGKTMSYSPPSGLDEPFREEVIHAFICKQKLLPGKLHVQDYNYRTPSLRLTAESQVSDQGRGEFHLYGEHFRNLEEGSMLADLRAQELRSHEKRFHGESTVPFLRPGYLFDLERHYRSGFNQQYLTIELEHAGSQSGFLISGIQKTLSESEQRNYYRNSFVAIPSEIQYRQPQKSQKPRFFGTINATIDAEGRGEYAELDDQGRYKVRFPFDLSGRDGGKASHWVRMAQPYAGTDHGMHFPLHKGTEVLLTFVEGDPDRPIIAGAVPNPERPSPIQDANQTKAAITTSGQNKIHFEDQAGKQRILMHSPTADSWVRIGSHNDPPNPCKVDEGDDVSTFTDSDGSWELNSSDRTISSTSVRTNDDGAKVTYRLTRVFTVEKKDLGDHRRAVGSPDNFILSSADHRESCGSDYQTTQIDFTADVAIKQLENPQMPGPGWTGKEGTWESRQAGEVEWTEIDDTVISASNRMYLGDGDSIRYNTVSPRLGAGVHKEAIWNEVDGKYEVVDADSQAFLDDRSKNSGPHEINSEYWYLDADVLISQVGDTQQVSFYRDKQVRLNVAGDVAAVTKTEGQGIRIQSSDNVWIEAENRYANYMIQGPDSSDVPHEIKYLWDKFYASSPAFDPPGMMLYDYGDGVSNPVHADEVTSMKSLAVKGQVTLAKGDTFNTQEGNIYDFGGYWNYNLGNSYEEAFMVQSIGTPQSGHSCPAASTPPDPLMWDACKDCDMIKDKKVPGCARLNAEWRYDIFDPGGPYWTAVNWDDKFPKKWGDTSKGYFAKDDVLVGDEDDWKTGCDGVWVTKAFGNSYDYREGHSIEVAKGDSLGVQHGGVQTELTYRDSGAIKSWSRSTGDGDSKQKLWTSGGVEYLSSHTNFKTEPFFHTETRHDTALTNIPIYYEYTLHTPWKNCFSFIAKLDGTVGLSVTLSGGADIGIEVSGGFKASLEFPSSLHFTASIGLLAIGIKFEKTLAQIEMNNSSGEMRYHGIGSRADKDAKMNAKIQELAFNQVKMNLKNSGLDVTNLKTELKVQKMGVNFSNQLFFA